MRAIRDSGVGFLIFLLMMGCARGPASRSSELAQEADTSWSKRRGLEMGQQIHQAITSSFQVYSEPRLVGYVSRVGRSLARQADHDGMAYQFTVLYDDRLYSTSAPGGFVYVTTGFLNFLQNEAELAAILAHEIALLQFGDPERSTSRKAMNIITQGGAVAAPFLGPIGTLAAGGLMILNALFESKVAAPEVRIRKADRKALRLLVAARQDPQGYLDVFGRLLNPNREWMPYLYDFSMSHPVTLERFREVMSEFEDLSLEGRSFSVQRDRYLLLTRGVREIYHR